LDPDVLLKRSGFAINEVIHHDDVIFTVVVWTRGSGIQSSGRFQRKASAAYTISLRVPLTFYVNYGRGNYKLDGEDATSHAAGLDVLDFSMRQRIRLWVDFNFSIDNLTNKRYFETQNYFESRVSPTALVITRTHGTPGYSIRFTAGLTFHLGVKK